MASDSEAARVKVLTSPDLVNHILSLLPTPELRWPPHSPGGEAEGPQQPRRTGRENAAPLARLRHEPRHAASQVNRLFRRLALALPWDVGYSGLENGFAVRRFFLGLQSWLRAHSVQGLDVACTGDGLDRACRLLLACPTLTRLRLQCCEHEPVLHVAATCSGLTALTLCLHDPDPDLREWQPSDLRPIKKLQGLQSLAVFTVFGEFGPTPFDVTWVAALGQLTALTLQFHRDPAVRGVPRLRHLYLRNSNVVVDDWESPQLTSLALRNSTFSKRRGLGTAADLPAGADGTVAPVAVACPWLGRLQRLELTYVAFCYRPEVLWGALSGLTSLSVCDKRAGEQKLGSFSMWELQSVPTGAGKTSVADMTSLGPPKTLRCMHVRLVPEGAPDSEGSMAHYLASLRALRSLQVLKVDLTDATLASIQAAYAYAALLPPQAATIHCDLQLAEGAELSAAQRHALHELPKS